MIMFASISFPTLYLTTSQKVGWRRRSTIYLYNHIYISGSVPLVPWFFVARIWLNPVSDIWLFLNLIFYYSLSIKYQNIINYTNKTMANGFYRRHVHWKAKIILFLRFSRRRSFFPPDQISTCLISFSVELTDFYLIYFVSVGLASINCIISN